MTGKVNEAYRFWYTLKLTSGAPATSVAGVDQTVTIRNPSNTATMAAPTIVEFGGGLYYFDISATFTNTNGVGQYGGTIEVNSSSPVLVDMIPANVEFFIQDIDDSALDTTASTLEGHSVTQISSTPGQSVGISVEVLDVNGERVDGYIPQIDYVINPLNVMQNGFPLNMTNRAVGVYNSNITIPSGVTAIGTYIASVSWSRPGRALTQYQVFLISISLPLGATVSPG